MEDIYNKIKDKKVLQGAALIIVVIFVYDMLRYKKKKEKFNTALNYQCDNYSDEKKKYMKY